MHIINAVTRALGVALLRIRALAGNAMVSLAAGPRIRAALYDGYVGAYAEFYRNEYTHEAARR
jgi:hypothetical protein